MDIWLRFDGYTPYYYYKVLEKRHSENKISKSISLYAKKKITDSPKSLSKSYLAKNGQWLSRQNVQFIENARETYEAGLRASSHIKPILYHYSWNSFLAFLMYTFLRFDGVAKGHGITVTKMQRDEINLEFHPFKRKGFFQRILDVLTVLGYPLAFARWMPVVDKNDNVIFVENNISSISNVKKMNLRDILTFNADNYIRNIKARARVKPDTDPQDLTLMNECIKNFIMLFTASTISRYKPHFWTEILEGEGEYESMLLTQVRNAYDFYVYFVTHVHSNILEPSI